MLYLTDYTTEPSSIKEHTLVNSKTLDWRIVTASDCYELLQFGTDIKNLSLVGKDVPDCFTVLKSSTDYAEGLLYESSSIFLPDDILLKGSFWIVYRCGVHYYFKSRDKSFMTLSPASPASGMTYILEDTDILNVGYGAMRYELKSDGSYHTYIKNQICEFKFNCIVQADITYKEFLRKHVIRGGTL